MKKIALAIGAILVFAACSKDKTTTTTTDVNTNPTIANQDSLETTVISDFTSKVALPQYAQLAANANALDATITTLSASPTDANLANAQTAWKTIRTTWEQCEGFLFGPVEDNEYDPRMDTWPTDYVEMDSLLSHSTSITEANIENNTTVLSLRGMHPIEYILWGTNGQRTAADISAIQMQYLVALSADVKNICNSLNNDWQPSGNNYAAKVLSAGPGNATFSTRKDLFIAMVNGLIAICDEVGTGKMEEPYAAKDSTIVESPYSNNSTIDFKNNIVGLQNVYLGRFTQSGYGLSDLVVAHNLSLDNSLRTQMDAAISSFNNITMPYGEAVLDPQQRQLIAATQTKLATLRTTLTQQLLPYIQQYITD